MEITLIEPDSNDEAEDAGGVISKALTTVIARSLSWWTVIIYLVMSVARYEVGNDGVSRSLT